MRTRSSLPTWYWAFLTSRIRDVLLQKEAEYIQRALSMRSDLSGHMTEEPRAHKRTCPAWGASRIGTTVRATESSGTICSEIESQKKWQTSLGRCIRSGGPWATHTVRERPALILGANAKRAIQDSRIKSSWTTLFSYMLQWCIRLEQCHSAMPGPLPIGGKGQHNSRWTLLRWPVLSIVWNI